MNSESQGVIPSGWSIVRWAFLRSLVTFWVFLSIAVLFAVFGKGKIVSDEVEVRGWMLLVYLLTTPPAFAGFMSLLVAVTVCPGLWLIRKVRDDFGPRWRSRAASSSGP